MAEKRKRTQYPGELKTPQDLANYSLWYFNSNWQDRFRPQKYNSYKESAKFGFAITYDMYLLNYEIPILLVPLSESEGIPGVRHDNRGNILSDVPDVEDIEEYTSKYYKDDEYIGVAERINNIIFNEPFYYTYIDTDNGFAYTYLMIETGFVISPETQNKFADIIDVMTSEIGDVLPNRIIEIDQNELRGKKEEDVNGESENDDSESDNVEVLDVDIDSLSDN